MTYGNPLRENEISELAGLLDGALLEGHERERLTVAAPSLTLADSYRIQDAGLRLRYARGERPIGLKMGLTSEAKRKQMNLESPIYGVLTDRMQVKDGGSFSLRGTIHPKIEPEIAFVVARELRGIPTREEAIAACSGVCAAMEILDSRYVGFKYFSLPDVVADNASSAWFVRSETLALPNAADWSSLEMRMSIGGQVVQKAISSEISGDPVLSVVQLCELLHERGLHLPAGSLVLAGAATQAVQLTAGMQVRLDVTGLAPVSISVSA